VVWPWIATLGLLGLLTVVVLVAILSEPQATNPSPSPTQSPTQSETVTESEPVETEEPANILLLRSEIIGQDLSAVTARLTELGFEVNAIPGELIAGDDPRVRTIYAVSPTGSVPKGSTIDITYYVGDFQDIPVDIPSTESDPVEPSTDSPESGGNG
jgi:serine/threonine-protein kinase